MERGSKIAQGEADKKQTRFTVNAPPRQIKKEKNSKTESRKNKENTVRETPKGNLTIF